MFEHEFLPFLPVIHAPPLSITDNDIRYVTIFVMLAFPQEKISHYTTGYDHSQSLSLVLLVVQSAELFHKCKNGV